MNARTLSGLMLLGFTLQGVAAAVSPQNVAEVEILSATIRDQKIEAASVIVQVNGQQSVATSTDSRGRATVLESLANNPSALIIVRKTGYSDLVAKCPCAGMTYAVSPIMYNLDGVRIVLNWGAHPVDLDGHLEFAGHHVSFSNRQTDDAQLDVDRLNGYGPETITIVRRHSGERYVYAVHDFWDRKSPDTAALSASDAKVFVYVGQTLVRTYYVPKNEKGNIWTVFAISKEGELQDINSMSGAFALSSYDVTTELLFGDAHGRQSRASTEPTPNGTAYTASDPARKLNTQGEAAYRAADYSRALQLFQAAIDLDGRYGQAYSNLGLVFQKSGRVAEALWANRKAIALADGPNAATTRASTHFNNGRIYEQQSQWADALREYRAAQNERSNSVYETAITRMEQHGANQP